jgi:hypothetical protein
MDGGNIFRVLDGSERSFERRHRINCSRKRPASRSRGRRRAVRFGESSNVQDTQTGIPAQRYWLPPALKTIEESGGFTILTGYQLSDGQVRTRQENFAKLMEKTQIESDRNKDLKNTRFALPPIHTAADYSNLGLQTPLEQTPQHGTKSLGLQVTPSGRQARDPA